MTFLRMADVARELGVSRWTARRMIRTGRVPGGERMYAHGKGERWHVRAATFWEWRKAVSETG